ncbi:hypothetical protein J2S08_001270 [Bacillus chungangensis]|uniref:Uncharacterized protein n=1 Tax=Bacillus chungangensis TaxID=587633 RepID=A0ABT9WQ73_9BACI|nr:hypothetical protein [Bacillus chungangensis]
MALNKIFTLENGQKITIERAYYYPWFYKIKMEKKSFQHSQE